MALANIDDAPFDVNVTDPDTGEQWKGAFRAKKKLSFRDQLDKDKMRRTLFGSSETMEENEAFRVAAALSELSVRLTESPKWWQESNNGLELSSYLLFNTILEGAFKVQKDYVESLKKQAEPAKEEIKEELNK